MVFRASPGLVKSKFKGIFTMLIGNSSDKKIMIKFKLNKANLVSANNSFYVGIPDAGATLKDMKKVDYQSLVFKKTDKEEQKEISVPKTLIPGEFHLKCLFGTGSHSRCAAILSQTPF